MGEHHALAPAGLASVASAASAPESSPMHPLPGGPIAQLCHLCAPGFRVPVCGPIALDPGSGVVVRLGLAGRVCVCVCVST